MDKDTVLLKIKGDDIIHKRGNFSKNRCIIKKIAVT